MSTDTKRLDYLQSMLDEGNYTGRCVLRQAAKQRSFMLHETGDPEGVDCVRTAIDMFMDRIG